MEKDKAFSTREWLFVVVIIMGLQFILHTVSYLYSGSPNALGYVSFAGTIVSILLGLIAIIYSFVQSISHGGSVRDVKEQAAKLVEAGREIVVSKNTLSESAERLSAIADSLINRINENTDATNKVASVVSKINGSLEGGLGKISENPADVSKHSILGSNRIWVVVMVICVGEAVKRSWTSNDIDREIITPLCEVQGMDKTMGSSVYFTIAMCLEAEGYIVFSGENAVDSYPISSNGFDERVRELVSSNIKSDEAEYVSLRKIIKDLEAK